MKHLPQGSPQDLDNNYETGCQIILENDTKLNKKISYRLLRAFVRW